MYHFISVFAVWVVTSINLWPESSDCHWSLFHLLKPLHLPLTMFRCSVRIIISAVPILILAASDIILKDGHWYFITNSCISWLFSFIQAIFLLQIWIHLQLAHSFRKSITTLIEAWLVHLFIFLNLL